LALQNPEKISNGTSKYAHIDPVEKVNMSMLPSSNQDALDIKELSFVRKVSMFISEFCSKTKFVVVVIVGLNVFLLEKNQ
jgi:hypothetical protein